MELLVGLLMGPRKGLANSFSLSYTKQELLGLS
jgi:hypothetical protein